MNIAFLIFISTYVIIAIQNIPKVHISRPAGALVGAVFMVLCGVITLPEAYAAIDLDTILFVLGMMIIVAYIELSGFFEIAENFILRHARTPSMLLFFLIFSAGLLSSVFMNDTICLLLTPMVLRITRKVRINPVPYLIALATSSNIGSVMTIIGNPQNMLIGLYSNISFLHFLRILAPVSIIGLGINFLIIRMVYAKDITTTSFNMVVQPSQKHIQKWLLFVSFVALIALIVLLSIGVRPPSAAITIACFLIIAAVTKPQKALEEVDWTLLLFFAGLFIVMKGVDKSGLTTQIFNYVKNYFNDGIFVRILSVSGAATVLSNVISNVPAVMLFTKIFESVQQSQVLWLTLAMASTLAGNLTIIGSVANIIVFESAKKEVNVSFFEYLKVGIPLTFITLILGVLLLLWNFRTLG